MSISLLRELHPEYEEIFLAAMQASTSLHHPWVNPPLTPSEFQSFCERMQQPNQKCYLVFAEHDLAGVINLTEMVHGCFQSAYLGFYGVSKFAQQGYMSAGLKLVLEKAFREIGLHRVEANVQPGNYRCKTLLRHNRFRYEGFSPRYLKINDKWCGHERWAMTLEDYSVNDENVINKDHIDIIAYQADWPKNAELEIERIKSSLPNIIDDIQHVGSTAVPGLAAKPIIDIQVGVKSLETIKKYAIQELEKLDYVYWAENPDPNRLFFVKGMPPYGEQRTHHVHVVSVDSPAYRDKIIFRDYLRSHPEAAKNYSELKTRLALEFSVDREKYTEKKTDFIKTILTEINNR